MLRDEGQDTDPQRTCVQEAYQTRLVHLHRHPATTTPPVLTNFRCPTQMFH